MPIIIMKTDASPVAISWIRPHAVWNGPLKGAVDWCTKKNGHRSNHTTHYEAVRVKNEGISEHD